MQELENLHELDVEEVYKVLDTGPQGLSEDESQKRLATYGLNEIRSIKGTPLWKKAISHFTNFFAILLWVGAIMAFFSNQAALGYAIIGVIGALPFLNLILFSRCSWIR